MPNAAPRKGLLFIGKAAAAFVGKVFHPLRLRDWLWAGGVGTLAFLAVQASAVLGVGVYRDTPLPFASAAGTIALGIPLAPEHDIREGAHAELIISKLGVRVPIVWSQSEDEADIQRDLERGAIHYPHTGIPGAPGNALIAGHSSDYFWSPGDYKNVFARLGELQVGEEDITVVYQSSGGRAARTIPFRITEKAVVSATDPRLFLASDRAEMTLVTCWPVGTSWWRLMVKTERVENGAHSL